MNRGVRKWLTEKQLIEHFGDKDVALAVIARKQDVPDLNCDIRDHPELPGSLTRCLLSVAANDIYLSYIYVYNLEYARPQAVFGTG